MVVQEELQYVMEGGCNLSTFYTVRNYQRMKRNCESSHCYIDISQVQKARLIQVREVSFQDKW